MFTRRGFKKAWNYFFYASHDRGANTLSMRCCSIGFVPVAHPQIPYRPVHFQREPLPSPHSDIPNFCRCSRSCQILELDFLFLPSKTDNTPRISLCSADTGKKSVVRTKIPVSARIESSAMILPQPMIALNNPLARRRRRKLQLHTPKRERFHRFCS